MIRNALERNFVRAVFQNLTTNVPMDPESIEQALGLCTEYTSSVNVSVLQDAGPDLGTAGLPLDDLVSRLRRLHGSVVGSRFRRLPSVHNIFYFDPNTPVDSESEGDQLTCTVRYFRQIFWTLECHAERHFSPVRWRLFYGHW